MSTQKRLAESLRRVAAGACKRGAIYRVSASTLLAALRAHGCDLPPGALLMGVDLDGPAEGPVKLKVWHDSLPPVEEGAPYPWIDLE